jgi:hypothetical protein
MVIQSEQFFFKTGAGRYASLKWCSDFILALEGGGAEMFRDSQLIAALSEFVSRSLKSWINTCIFRYETNNILVVLWSLLLALKVGHVILELKAWKKLISFDTCRNCVDTHEVSEK